MFDSYLFKVLQIFSDVHNQRSKVKRFNQRILKEIAISERQDNQD